MAHRRIAFLHTSPAHVATFAALVAAADPSVAVDHVVREDLLAAARSAGVDRDLLSGEVHDAMRDAARSGAAVVVCTCSTIGAMAERTPAEDFTPQRIDRAMADRAVRAGPRILALAALESTAEPTLELLRESADALGSAILPELSLVRGAWAHFERGDLPAYDAAVAQAVRSGLGRADVVVLAQASMEGALALLTDVPVPVLASPRLGVEHALVSLADRA